MSESVFDRLAHPVSTASDAYSASWTSALEREVKDVIRDREELLAWETEVFDHGDDHVWLLKSAPLADKGSIFWNLSEFGVAAL